MIMYYIALYIGRLLQKRNNLTKLVAQTAIQERRSCAGSKTSRCRYQKQEGMSVVQGDLEIVGYASLRSASPSGRPPRGAEGPITSDFRPQACDYADWTRGRWATATLAIT